MPRLLLVVLIFCGGLVLASVASGHRDGCHRWHSCPSDSGSYACGDLGYTSECPGVSTTTTATTTTAPTTAVAPPADGDADGIADASDRCPTVAAATSDGCPTQTVSAPPPAPVEDAVDDEPVFPGGSTLTAGKTFTARVTKVIDGDTVRVRRSGGAADKVRLLGIDTPETSKPGVPVECGGRRASAFLRSLVLAQVVTLATDPTQDQRDRYGRLLAYVTVTSSGADASLRLLRAGWAEYYVYAGMPVQRAASYQVAADAARAEGTGVHGACGGDFHSAQR